MTSKHASRRQFTQWLFGSAGLAALATGLPAAFLRAPLAFAQGAPASCTPGSARFLILCSSNAGDPVNANCPGTYEHAGIVHAPGPESDTGWCRRVPTPAGTVIAPEADAADVAGAAEGAEGADAVQVLVRAPHARQVRRCTPRDRASRDAPGLLRPSSVHSNLSPRPSLRRKTSTVWRGDR